MNIFDDKDLGPRFYKIDFFIQTVNYYATNKAPSRGVGLHVDAVEVRAHL